MHDNVGSNKKRFPCKHNRYSFCKWKPLRMETWRRECSWLQNKQEKWEEIYAIRVSHSNPARCIFLHLQISLDERKTDSRSSFKLSILCLQLLGLSKWKSERKVSFCMWKITTRSMLMLIASVDGRFSLDLRIENSVELNSKCCNKTFDPIETLECSLKTFSS